MTRRNTNGIIPNKDACREIYRTALCVIGLSVMMMSCYIFTDRLDLSVVLGSIVGSTASIFNFALNVMTVQISAKYDSKKAGSIILASKILRAIPHNCQFCRTPIN